MADPSIRSRLRAGAGLKALLVGLAFGLTVAAAAAQGCGPETPCRIDGGEYRAALPGGSPKAAVLLLHGFGGSGEAEMRNAALLAQFTDRGYAVIAPTALPFRPGAPTAWNSQLDPARRDDVAFLDAATADAAARFGFARAAVLAAGFSDGGMMVWRLACDAPQRFAAFAPVSGVMWRPLPDVCAASVRLLHTHGWSDPVVPLEGRSIPDADLVQGDLFESLGLLRAASDCPDAAPSAYETRGGFLIRRWGACDPAADIVFALHAGGHAIPDGWAGMALDWFENPGAALAFDESQG